MNEREPMFNVPGSVLGALAVLAGVHLLLGLLDEERALWWTVALAFIPGRFVGTLAAELPGGTTATWTSFVTHMLVHADLTHLLFNGAWLLAFGGAVAQRIGGARCIAFALFCGIVGAATFLAVNYGRMAPMVGASGAISGLMGGVFRFLFNAEGAGGLWQLRNAPRSIPTMPLGQALTDQRVLVAIGIWIALNFVALLGIGGVSSSGGIAWEAHIGGFLAGFLTFHWFEGATPRSAEGTPWAR